MFTYGLAQPAWMRVVLAKSTPIGKGIAVPRAMQGHDVFPNIARSPLPNIPAEHMMHSTHHSTGSVEIDYVCPPGYNGTADQPSHPGSPGLAARQLSAHVLRGTSLHEGMDEESVQDQVHTASLHSLSERSSSVKLQEYLVDDESHSGH